MDITASFDGVFRLTNPTTEDFTFMWNNREYTFPAERTTPMIIRDATLEDINEIRKKAAYKLAVREFYKGKEYFRLSKMGNGLPPTFDEKLLQPFIDQCLKPLPAGKPEVKELPKESERKFKASKAISDKDNPNFVFREESESARALGRMPDKEI